MSVQSEKTAIIEEHLYETRNGVTMLRNSRISSTKITEMLGGPGPRAKSKYETPKEKSSDEKIWAASPQTLPLPKQQDPQLQLRPSKEWQLQIIAQLELRQPELVLTDLNIRRQPYLEPQLLQLERNGLALDYGDKVAYFPKSIYLNAPYMHNPAAVEIPQLVNAVWNRFNHLEAQGSETSKRIATTAVAQTNIENAKRPTLEPQKHQGVVANPAIAKPGLTPSIQTANSIENLALIFAKWAALDPTLEKTRRPNYPIQQHPDKAWQQFRSPNKTTQAPAPALPFNPTPTPVR